MKAKHVLSAMTIATFLALLGAGCGPSEKVAARVNKDVITEKDYLTRVQAVDYMSLGMSAQRGGASRAGEFAMRDILMERLFLQAAAEKHVSPTDAQVKDFAAFSKRYPAFVGDEARITGRTDAEWLQFARRQVAVRNIALKSVNITQKDIDQLYKDPVFQAQVKERDAYHVRLIVNTTEAKSREALEALRKGVPFETEAFKVSEDPQTRQNSGDAGYLLDTSMQPELREAVMKLKPNEYTKTPVRVTQSRAGALGGPTFFIIVQLVEKRAGSMPAQDAVKPAIESILVQRKNPQVGQYIQSTLRDFVAKSTIQVKVKEYEGLAAKLKASLTDTSAAPAVPQSPR
jgi:hypothetical protein